MAEGARAGLSFGLPALLTLVTVPLAIATARRTGFLDAPKGYKAHLLPTPYLGGAALLAAMLPVAVALDEEVVTRYWPLLAGALFLAFVGAIDDRVSLSPLLRLTLEVLAAGFLWAEGLGWSFLGSGALNLLFTAFWVAGLVNAFNLMDNLDGAASSVAAVSAGAVAVLAAIADNLPLMVVSASLCGALIGFLRFNLARPSQIFLGDGGSMPVGFLLAGALMTAPMGELSGWAAVATAAMIAGLPVFDTTLVVISRWRRGAPVLSGATDHTTHRLLVALRSPRAVAAALAGTQACLCGLAIEGTRRGQAVTIAIACGAFLVATGTVILAEGPQWMPASEDS